MADARALAEGYLAAANRHDVEAMIRLWKPGGREVFPPFGVSYEVPTGFRTGFGSLFTGIPDVAFDVLSITADEHRVVVQSEMHGTHVGEYQGLRGTGRSFRTLTADFMDVADGLIVNNVVLFDGVSVMRQLAGFPPSGSRRERVLIGVLNLATRARSIAR